MLYQLRIQEGRSIPDIALMLDRTAKAVERRLERKRWILNPRSTRPDLQDEIAQRVAAFEAEAGEA